VFVNMQWMQIIVYVGIRMHVNMNICMKVYTCDIC